MGLLGLEMRLAGRGAAADAEPKATADYDQGDECGWQDGDTSTPCAKSQLGIFSYLVRRTSG